MTQDIPKLYTAFAEWLSCAVVIAAQGSRSRRGSLSRTAPILAVGLFVLCGIQTLCGMTDSFLWLLGMAAAVLVLVGMLYGCLLAKLPNIWFLAARVFMRAEWMAALEWQLDRYYVPEGMENSFWYSGIFCTVFFCLTALLFFATERYFIRREMSFDRMDVSPQSAVGVWFFTLVFFSFSNLSYVEDGWFRIRIMLPLEYKDMDNT